MAPQTSMVWQHFTHVTDDHGNFVHRARCNYCTDEREFGTKYGTSNLWKHFNTFHQQEAAAALNCSDQVDPAADIDMCVAGTAQEPPQQLPLPCPEASGGYEAGIDFDSLWRELGSIQDRMLQDEEEAANRDLAQMIALHGYDPSFVDDDYFRSFVHHINPQFKLPSRLVIEDMCDGFFDGMRTDVFSRLRQTSGRVSLSVGKASGKADAIEGDELYLYTACHFIDGDWKLHRVVMDAYDHLPWALYHGPLSGVPEVSPSFHDLCALAIDRVMDENDTPDRDVLDRVFMVARDKRGKYIIEPKDYIQQNYPSTYPRKRELICDTYMDIVFHNVGRRLVLHPDLVTDMTKEHLIPTGVQNLRLTRQMRQHLLSHLGLDDLRTYNERWYSCYCSLKVLRSQGSSSIGGIDSELIGLLCNIWGTIYHTIKRISTSNSPTSNLVLKEMFSLREVLQIAIAQNGGHNADVLRDAQDTLDKSLLDTYLVWSIPLVLDPRYKLKFIEFNFKRVFSKKKAAYYIYEVTSMINKLYTDYAEYDGEINGTDVPTVMAEGSIGVLEQAWYKHRLTQGGTTPEVNSEAESELDRYLKDDLATETEGSDILGWWKGHTKEYPTVSRMARDALAMPTCSQLSSEQMAHIKSIIRGYSKKEYKHQVGVGLM